MKVMSSSRKRWMLALAVAVILSVSFLAGMSVRLWFGNRQATGGPSYILEYAMHEDSSPNAIAVDARGNVWFALENDTALGELFPNNSTVKEFRLPEPAKTGLQTWGIAVDNARGIVWFTDEISNAVWSFSVKNNSFAEHSPRTKNSSPYQVALDQNGNVWFTEFIANKIGEIENGVMKEFAVPPIKGGSNITNPVGIFVTNNGTVWFTEPAADAVGSLYNGTFHQYGLRGRVISPVGIAVDSKGNIWLTEHGPSSIAEFNPSKHLFRSISTSIPKYTIKSSLPYFVYVDGQDNVWFNEHYGNAVARFNPSNGVLIEYEVPSKSPVYKIAGTLTMALSGSGQPWFTELFTGKIGTVKTDVPINLGINVENSSRLSISGGGRTNLELVVQGGDGSTELQASSTNETAGFGFTFSKSSGIGKFTSELTITNASASPGTYYVTVSAITQDIVVSRVIELNVTA